MKKILITGAGSYIGVSVEAYLKQWPQQYQVDTVDMIGDAWKNCSFHGYDAVLHVAGLVHQPKTKNDPDQAERYDRINHRLAVETAGKAKAEGVRQFLFLSSASVYGLNAPVGNVVTITGDTPLNPTDNYGISKKKAEEGLQKLQDETFRVAILRPPMIYGKGCRGNYQTMAKLARKLPFFPWVENQRSMLYMENLAEFIRLLVESGKGGIFFPQNAEYTTTSQMVKAIGQVKGKKVRLWKGLSPLVMLASHVPGKIGGLVNKAFGSLTIDQELSRKDIDGYQIFSLEESIRRTEQ